MKLGKLPSTSQSFSPAGAFVPSPAQEAEYLKHKHLGLEHDDSFPQKPLGGFGGSGRPMKYKEQELTPEEEEKFWAQMVEHGDNQKRMLKGGHGVPLSGEFELCMFYRNS